MNHKVPIFLRAAEIAEILGISQPAAYRIIRDLNTELQQKGYMIQIGRVNRKYFAERYGLSVDDLSDQMEQLERGA